MASETVSSKTDVQALSAEVDALRARLNNEMENAAKMRDAHLGECRRLARGHNVQVLATKQRLDLVESQIEGIRAEIAERQRLLDDALRREAEESRQRQLEQDYQTASEQLAASQAEIAKLRAEYSALPEKIRLAEWHFHTALRLSTRPKKLRPKLQKNRRTFDQSHFAELRSVSAGIPSMLFDLKDDKKMGSNESGG